MSCRVMMTEFARRMNASMTRMRFSVQIWSLRKPLVCQDLSWLTWCQNLGLGVSELR